MKKVAKKIIIYSLVGLLQAGLFAGVAEAAAMQELRRADEAGVYALPDGMTFDAVQTILVDGMPVTDGRYAIVANNTAIDIFDVKDATVVTVVLK